MLRFTTSAALVTLLIAVLSGLVVMIVLKKRNSNYQIRALEFVIGLAACLLLTPFCNWGATALAKSGEADGYIKYVGGSLISSEIEDKNCKPGKPCMRDFWLVDSHGEQHAPKSRPHWLDVKSQIESGYAPPAMITKEYVNFFLESQQTLLKEYTGNIETYRKRELLAPHTQHYEDPIYDGFMAKQVVISGKITLPNEEAHQIALARLNAKVGTLFGGNVHILLVSNSQVNMAEAPTFATAMTAYWQSKEFGKNGLAENSIVVFLGVDDAAKNVVWAKAKSGIPVGNSELLAALELRLMGKALDPATLIGEVPTRSVNGKAEYGLSEGLIDQIVTRDYPYAAPCLDCEDGQNFVYLRSQDLISFQDWLIVVLLSLLPVAGVWWFFARMHFFERYRRKPGQTLWDVDWSNSA